MKQTGLPASRPPAPVALTVPPMSMTAVEIADSAGAAPPRGLDLRPRAERGQGAAGHTDGVVGPLTAAA